MGSTTEQLSRVRARGTLIERLRAHDSCHSVDLGLLDEAADRIEELEENEAVFLRLLFGELAYG